MQEYNHTVDTTGSMYDLACCVPDLSRLSGAINITPDEAMHCQQSAHYGSVSMHTHETTSES